MSIFERHNVTYEGVAIGEDVQVAQSKGRNVKKMDFTFLDYSDKSFDLVFARHALEHSPFPLITLMEWHRVAKSWLGIVLPAPEWYTYKGLNHYSVMEKGQIENLLERAGWRPIWMDVDEKAFGKTAAVKPHEYWYMCEKI